MWSLLESSSSPQCLQCSSSSSTVVVEPVKNLSRTTTPTSSSFLVRQKLCFFSSCTSRIIVYLLCIGVIKMILKPPTPGLFVSAQIHTFQASSTAVGTRQIVHVDLFFVFGAKDNPPSFLWLSGHQPTVTFENIRFSPTLPTDPVPNNSIQVTVVGDSIWKQYYSPLNRSEWCCPLSAKLQNSSLCPEKDKLARPTEEAIIYNVSPNTVKTHLVADQSTQLNSTDTYMLLISNCGERGEGQLEGRVIVRNYYGYLPGIDFPKLVFYFWMMLAYLVVLGIWTGLLFFYWKRAIHFHYCIEGVIFLGLLECVVQFVYYADWNTYGTRNSVLLVMSILTTVVKNIFSYMLVLVASLGWGVTKPTLERPVIFKIQAVVLLYIVLDSIRQVTSEFIFSPNLPVAQVILVVTCLVPISILNGVIFYWVFSSLTDLLEVLEEQKQFEKLQIFKRLLAVLIATLILFTIALFVQIYAAASDVTSRWQVHWWLSDGVPHLLFMLVLVVMMCLWKPNEHSRKLAYFQELPDDDELEDTSPKVGSGDVRVWGDELDLDEASSDDESDEHHGSNFDIPTHHSHPVDHHAKDKENM